MTPLLIAAVAVGLHYTFRLSPGAGTVRSADEPRATPEATASTKD